MKKHPKKSLSLGHETVRNLSAVIGASNSTSIFCVNLTRLCPSAANPLSGCTSCPSCADCTLL